MAAATMNFTDELSKIAKIDLFKPGKDGSLAAGPYVGRPFQLDYNTAHLLIADAWKQKVKGIPQGSFLLAYYMNEDSVAEALLLRVLGPTPLPTDRDVISSMVEYYKDNLKTSGAESQLDSFTRYEFSFSGLECRILSIVGEAQQLAPIRRQRSAALVHPTECTRYKQSCSRATAFG